MEAAQRVAAERAEAVLRRALHARVEVERVLPPAAHQRAFALQAREVLARIALAAAAPPADRFRIEAVAARREVGEVELVDHGGDAQAGLAHRARAVAAAQGRGHHLGRGAFQAQGQAHAQLAEFGPGLAEIDAERAALAVVEADDGAAVVVVARDVAAQRLGVGRHEPVVAQAQRPVQRVVDLGVPARHLADLQLVAPLAAVGVQPVAVVADLDVEAAAAAEVGSEVEADAEVVRAPGLVLEVEHETVALGAGDEQVVGAQVVAAGREPARIALGLGRIEGLAGPGLELGREALRVGQLRALEADERDPRLRLAGLRPGGAPLRVGGLGQRERGEPRRQRLAAALAGGDQLARALEVRRGELAQLGRDQHVLRAQRAEAALHVLLGEDVDHLRRQPAHRD